MKNTQQLIKEIEAEIKETHSLISTYKSQITQHEYLLNSLVRQLNQIKISMKSKQINSLQDSKLTK